MSTGGHKHQIIVRKPKFYVIDDEQSKPLKSILLMVDKFQEGHSIIMNAELVTSAERKRDNKDNSITSTKILGVSRIRDNDCWRIRTCEATYNVIDW